MAEDNTQDMAMEDILSSIKNILEEDEAGRKAEAPSAISEAEPAALKEAEPDTDDILDLSSDMRVDAAEEPAAAEGEINLEQELDEVKTPELNEEGSFEIKDVEPDESGQGVRANVNLGWEDLESDPFDAGEKEDAEPSSEEPAPQEDPDAVEMPAAVADLAPEESIFPEAEPVVETEPADEPQTETTYKPEPEPVLEPEPAVREQPVADSAVDVSANIISNFTRMFSHAGAKAAPEPEIPAEPIREIGDAHKTIEDMVADVIRRIIGAEVEQNWRQNADYDAYARQVIAEQAKSWLEANLPEIVETIVRREIERVMAKAGNNQ